jgi:hypothetical protein
VLREKVGLLPALADMFYPDFVLRRAIRAPLFPKTPLLFPMNGSVSFSPPASLSEGSPQLFSDKFLIYVSDEMSLRGASPAVSET